MAKTKVKKVQIQSFAFNSGGLDEARRHIVNQCLRSPPPPGQAIKCAFLDPAGKIACRIEFIPDDPYAKGVYGNKEHSGRFTYYNPESPENIVGSIKGINMPVTDFQKFRKTLEKAGVQIRTATHGFGSLDLN